MQEFGRQSIENLLDNRDRQREKFAADQERIRQNLETKGRKIIEQYQQRRKDLEPTANQELETVIKPWWKNLIDSGTYSRLAEVAKTDDIHNVLFSDPIVYPYPYNVLRELTSTKPYDYNAKLIAEYTSNGNIRQAQSQEAWCAGEGDNVELWRATFYIEGHYYDQSTHGFGISQQPLFGGGFGSAAKSKMLQIPSQYEEANQFTTKIHPIVLIEFSDQVRSGRVWEAIRDSLTTKPVIPSLEEYNRRMVKLKEQYLSREHGNL